MTFQSKEKTVELQAGDLMTCDKKFPSQIQTNKVLVEKNPTEVYQPEPCIKLISQRDQ